MRLKMMLSNSECDHSVPSTLQGSFHISEASHCPMRYVRMVIVSILPIRKLSLRRVTILLRAHRWQAVPLGLASGFMPAGPFPLFTPQLSAWLIVILTRAVDCICVYEYSDCSLR